MAENDGESHGTGLTRAGVTVLVADDEPMVRRVAVQVLQRAGYRVLEACDGVDALAISRRHDGEIALLLTDVVMPRLAGPALAAELRRERPGIGVLFMSGFAEEVLLGHGLRISDVVVLAKPFDSESLTRAVRAALGR